MFHVFGHLGGEDDAVGHALAVELVVDVFVERGDVSGLHAGNTGCLLVIKLVVLFVEQVLTIAADCNLILAESFVFDVTRHVLLLLTQQEAVD